MKTGVSVVICCHNSAKRLQKTLGHLVAQEVPVGIPWEVIVVDNGSTDGTSDVASRTWPSRSSVPFRVVKEDRAGLSYARRRGFEEAQYGIISYVDDDNWLEPNWVRIAAEVMEKHSNVGACGGQSEAVCEVAPPAWFDAHKGSYAVGEQAPKAGDVAWTRGFLWGAGLTVRREALAQLFDRGFRCVLEDRSGNALSSGGDSELCLALRLAGWRLYYEPEMRFKHFIPERRLTWNYLRRLHRGFGRSKPVLELYRKAHLVEQGGFRKHWTWQTMRVVRSIVSEHARDLRRFLLPVGQNEVLALESKIGRLSELLKLRGKLAQLDEQIRSAKWRIKAGPSAINGSQVSGYSLDPQQAVALSVWN
ncbi:MAG TPA: glycosyltransferase [Candidatus Eisenbacteria bacterium]|nr:glycosyltransferase [Candidatus Eisenbacteria bacterium]